MVSNIGDGYADKFPKKWPNWYPPPPQTSSPFIIPPQVSSAEFEALRKEVQELKKLLEAAKKFDEATGQPECEMEEKVKLIRAIAKLVGVDLGDVFGPKPQSA